MNLLFVVLVVQQCSSQESRTHPRLQAIANRFLHHHHRPTRLGSLLRRPPTTEAPLEFQAQDSSGHRKFLSRFAHLMRRWRRDRGGDKNFQTGKLYHTAWHDPTTRLFAEFCKEIHQNFQSVQFLYYRIERNKHRLKNGGTSPTATK